MFAGIEVLGRGLLWYIFFGDAMDWYSAQGLRMAIHREERIGKHGGRGCMVIKSQPCRIQRTAVSVMKGAR